MDHSHCRAPKATQRPLPPPTASGGAPAGVLPDGRKLGLRTFHLCWALYWLEAMLVEVELSLKDGSYWDGKPYRLCPSSCQVRVILSTPPPLLQPPAALPRGSCQTGGNWGCAKSIYVECCIGMASHTGGGRCLFAWRVILGWQAIQVGSELSPKHSTLHPPP